METHSHKFPWTMKTFMLDIPNISSVSYFSHWQEWALCYITYGKKAQMSVDGRVTAKPSHS